MNLHQVIISLYPMCFCCFVAAAPIVVSQILSFLFCDVFPLSRQLYPWILYHFFLWFFSLMFNPYSYNSAKYYRVHGSICYRCFVSKTLETVLQYNTNRPHIQMGQGPKTGI